jgi:hypothetical protein
MMPDWLVELELELEAEERDVLEAVDRWLARRERRRALCRWLTPWPLAAVVDPGGLP